MDPFTRNYNLGGRDPFTGVIQPTTFDTIVDNRDTDDLDEGDTSKAVKFLDGDNSIRIISKKKAGDDVELLFEYYDEDTGQYTSLLTLGTDGVRVDVVSGEYHPENHGAVGIESNVDTLSSSVEKIDDWIYRNIIASPPAPTDLLFFSNTTTSISVVFDKPTIYEIGLLNQTVPFITGLSVEIYKHDNEITLSSGSVSVTQEQKTVTGDSTTFTSLEIVAGDSITVQNGAISGTVEKTEGSTTLQGTDTNFTGDLQVGVEIMVSGEKRRVTSITSATSLEVDNAFGSSGSGITASYSETRIIEEIVSDTSILVDRSFDSSMSNKGDVTFVSYPSSPTDSYDTLTTTVSELPREGSDITAVEALTVFMDGGTSGVSGNVNSKVNYSIANSGNLENDSFLKVEVYYKNYNNTLSVNRARISNIQFKQPGAPGPVSNIQKIGDNSIQIQLRWVSPEDHDSTEAGNQTTPAMASSDTYQIVYESSSLATDVYRFGGVQSHESQTASHTHTGGAYQSTQNKTITSLKPGQTYSFSISAKNSINSGYGTPLSENFDTIIPSRPSLFSSYSLTKSEDTYPENGRTLSSTSSVSNILKHGNLDTTIDYNELSNFAVNENNDNQLESDIHAFETSFGTTSIETDIDSFTEFRAFASSMPHASESEESGEHTRVSVSGQEDVYSGDQQGFWSRMDLTLKVNKSSIPASPEQYTVQLRKMASGSSLHQLQDTFNVDDLTTGALAEDLTLVSFPSDTNASSISGVPSRGNGFQIRYDFSIRHLGRYYVRTDSFATMSLKNNSYSLSSNVQVSPSGYTSPSSFIYSDESGTPTDAIDSSKNIKFTSQTLTYSDPSSGLYTDSSNTDSFINVSIVPKNILGNGQELSLYGIDSSNDFDNNEKKIYVDTVSSRYLSSHYGKSSSGSSPRVHYPSMVHLSQGFSSSSVKVPTVSSESDHAAYSHSSSITSGAYQQELQFTNGRFRTKHSSNGAYLNYSSTFLDHTSTSTSLGSMPDYSSVSDADFRYATFEFDLSSGSSSTISYFDIKFYDFSLGTQSADGVISPNSDPDLKNFRMYVKLIDNGNYTPSTSNKTSVWLDANAILETAVARSQTNYSDSSRNGTLAVLQNSSSGNTNDTDTKRVVIVAGTSTTNLIVLVRIGLRMNQNMNFGRIELECE